MVRTSLAERSRRAASVEPGPAVAPAIRPPTAAPAFSTGATTDLAFSMAAKAVRRAVIASDRRAFIAAIRSLRSAARTASSGSLRTDGQWRDSFSDPGTKRLWATAAQGTRSSRERQPGAIGARAPAQSSRVTADPVIVWSRRVCAVSKRSGISRTTLAAIALRTGRGTSRPRLRTARPAPARFDGVGGSCPRLARRGRCTVRGFAALDPVAGDDAGALRQGHGHTATVVARVGHAR